MDTTKYKKRLGDRKEGHKLKTLEPMNIAIPFLMSQRNDATNYFEDNIELTELMKYIHAKRKEGMPGFNVMHILVAAYIRTVAKNPGINRFVSGMRIYKRKNIQIIMEVKKRLELNAPGTMVKFEFMPDATVYDVYNQMNKLITEYKESSDEPNSFDKLTGVLKYFPRFVFRFFVAMLKIFDYFDWLPTWLLFLSPFHGSLVITSMASLNIKPVYHHLYNFGNVPCFVSFSTARHENGLDNEGKLIKQHFMDLRFSTDERICDGQYYAVAIQELKRIFKTPEILENKPECVIEDID